MRLASKLFLCCLITPLLMTTAYSTPQPRTIEMFNNCPSDILWGISGTPIKTQGSVVACNTNTVGSPCHGWAGSVAGDEGICDSVEDGVGPFQCYFKYPQVNTTNTNPDYYLQAGEKRFYTITPVTRLDANNNTVVQYTFNIGPQTDCSIDAGTGLFTCKSGTCGGRVSGQFDGQCRPSKGQIPPFTQIEMTTNDAQNDFYDLSVINGANLPVKIEAVGTPGNQNFQSQFWCTSPGAAPNSNPALLNGCSWDFNPVSTGKPASVFLQIDRSGINPAIRCTSDSDCTTPGQKCGLSYPDDLKTYNSADAKPAYCGVPLGYYTVTDICALSLPGAGLSDSLSAMFKCQDTITLSAPDGSQTVGFTNTDLYQCKTQGAWTIGAETGKYLDSCYNYTNKTFSTSSFCCGCIDWPGVPTDENVSCANTPSGSPVTPSSTVYPNADWKSTVQPFLKWLVDACPDAYEYQYGDKHGTIQCSTEDTATTSGNSMNYRITFCPEGKTLFSGNSNASIEINNQAVDVVSSTAAIINWDVLAKPATNSSYDSVVTLNNDPSTARSCGQKTDCSVTYQSLGTNMTYIATITGVIHVGGTTVTAIPREVRFSTSTTASVTIDDAAAQASSDNSIDASWVVNSVPNSTVTSNASIAQANNILPSLQSCTSTSCHATFTGLTANTNYNITIHASSAQANAVPVNVFAKTAAATQTVSVFPPTKGEMKLTNILGPGAYCLPTTLRFPLLNTCQSNPGNGYRCVNKTIDGENIGEWYINQLPICSPQTDYDFSHITQLTASYGGGHISFTFIPNPPWQCVAVDGNRLSCTT